MKVGLGMSRTSCCDVAVSRHKTKLLVSARSVLYLQSSCQEEAKEEKVLERGAPSVTERFFVITSRVSQSQLFAVWLAEVE